MPRLTKSAMKLALLVGLLHGLETVVTVTIGRFLPVPVYVLVPAALLIGGGVGWWIAIRHDHTPVTIEEWADDVAGNIWESGGTFLDNDGYPVSYRGPNAK